jgi:hypothetical protein
MTRPFLVGTCVAALLAAGVAWPKWNGPIAMASADRPSIAASASGGLKRFVGVAAAPVADAPGGAPFATLYVSADFAMAGIEAGAAHFTSRLWLHGDAIAPGPLYTAPKGVEIGWLEGLRSVRAVAGTAGNGWTLVEIDGYLPAAAVVDNLETLWRGAELDYRFICADCHTTHAAKDYSSMQWGIIMPRMARNAKLAPDAALVILKWLQTTSFASDTRRPMAP